MTVNEICTLTKAASYTLADMNEDRKNEILLAMADELTASKDIILLANDMDLRIAKKSGMSESMLDRLKLTRERIDDMARGIRNVAELPDPCAKVLSARILKNGLTVNKVTVPFGVIGIIYEARPNVTSDAAALCIKAGSSVILRGGKDAVNSNVAIVTAMRSALDKMNLDRNIIGFIDNTSRESAVELMQSKGLVDVLIPRGGAGLIKSVTEQSLVPVIETGTGNCHAYIEKSADPKVAAEVILNGKTSRPSVCNALESIVIDREAIVTILPRVIDELHAKGVTVHADESTLPYVGGGIPATQEDFGKEYLGLEISIKTVDSVDEAIAHINKYSTGHSEVIITRDNDAAQKFTRLVDSACVYVNASTRFTDGEQFGLGAEIGISTQKLHARGPMGLEQIVSYKYIIQGVGQIRK